MQIKDGSRASFLKELGPLWGGTLFHRVAAPMDDKKRQMVFMDAKTFGVAETLKMFDKKRVYCISGRVLFDADQNLN